MITSTRASSPSPAPALQTLALAERADPPAVRPRPHDLLPPPAHIEPGHPERFAFAGMTAIVLGTCLFVEFDESQSAHTLGLGLICGGLASISIAIGRLYCPAFLNRIP